MPFGKILPRPGVNVEMSPTLNREGWSASQLIRFKQGLAEKLGGWEPLCATPVVGVGTGMHSWGGADGTPYLMVGTNERLQIINGGILYDITPLRFTHNVAVNFTTTIGTKVVRIVDVASDTAPGDWVYIVVHVSVGGLILQGFYQVTNTIDVNTYEINAATNATASVAAGGAVPAFTTTNTSATVLVTLANHGLTTGGTFFIPVSTTGGGVTLQGLYNVTVLTANTFNISAAVVATSSVTFSENAGNARFKYLIHSGFGMNTFVAGWGIGDYGSGDYGLAGAVAKALMRQWTGDSWGNDLVACYTRGPIYQWTPPPANILPGNIADAAVILTNAPQDNTTLFVHSQAEILVAAGCEVGGVFDPLLVRWSDQDDLSVWIAASGNFAGKQRLKSGSRIVGAMMVPQGGLIWTDVGLWSMQFIGYPEVFGFTTTGISCGLIAMRAAGFLNSTVFWMGRNNFYFTSPGGTPQTLPCTVWDQVFQNLNLEQTEEIFCAVNPLFSEMWWFHPSLNSDTVDSYVKVSLIDGTWDYGLLSRTAWDSGLVLGAPVGCEGGTNLVQQHETSNDANGAGLPWSITTGFYDVGEGEEFFIVDQIWPDFVQTPGSVVQITASVVDYPGQAPRIYGPYNMTQGTKQFIALNARGRQISLTFAASDVGSFVRLGATRYRYAPSGRKGGA